MNFLVQGLHIRNTLAMRPLLAALLPNTIALGQKTVPSELEAKVAAVWADGMASLVAHIKNLLFTWKTF